jgi:ribosome-associated protein
MTKTPPSVEDVLQTVRASLDDDKAQDVSVIPLAGKSTIADFMVVASGTSKRHVGAMADHLVRLVEKLGAPFVAVEGATHCDWVLIDTGDVLIHLFRPEIREFYALERLWGAPAITAGRTAAGHPAVGR